MMFSRPILIATICLSSAHVHAQEQLVGLWGFENCENATSIEYQGYLAAAFHNGDRIEIISQEFLQAQKPEWYLNRTDPTDAFPSLMRNQNGKLVQAWLKDEVPQEQIPSIHRDLLSGALNPEEQPEEFDINVGTKCPGLPVEASLAFGEAMAFLQSVDEALWSCREDTSSCPKDIFGTADISGDGELSVAELARVFRSSLAIGSASSQSTSQGEFAATFAAGFAIAPLAGSAVLYSFDYDRSGRISFEELMGERLPASWNVRPTDAGTITSLINRLSEVARSASGAAGVFFR